MCHRRSWAELDEKRVRRPAQTPTVAKHSNSKNTEGASDNDCDGNHTDDDPPRDWLEPYLRFHQRHALTSRSVPQLGSYWRRCRHAGQPSYVDGASTHQETSFRPHSRMTVMRGMLWWTDSVWSGQSYGGRTQVAMPRLNHRCRLWAVSNRRAFVYLTPVATSTPRAAAIDRGTTSTPVRLAWQSMAAPQQTEPPVTRASKPGNR
jgi:hypothetical protein